MFSFSHRAFSFHVRLIFCVALPLGLGAAPARAQRRSAENPAAAAQARHLAPIPPPTPVAPPVRPVRPPQPILPPVVSPIIPPVPGLPPVEPQPINPFAIRPAVPPVQPAVSVRRSSSLLPHPLGVRPIKTDPSLDAPPPIEPVPPQRPPSPRSVLPNGTLAPTPYAYCSPFSVLYNTGPICFDPDLFTLNPAFLPIEPYVPPPAIGAPGQPDRLLIPPSLLLEYCPTCATQNAGLAPANRILKIPRGKASAPPSPGPITPSGPPMILVLKDGTMPVVGHYWLGNDWLIHFVTIGGQQGAIPFDELNLNATGQINYQRGAVFSIPGWPNP